MSNSKKNNGQIVQDIIAKFESIRTDAQYAKFIELVKKTRFGTYGTMTIIDIVDGGNFELKYINKFHKDGFYNEVKTILSRN